VGKTRTRAPVYAGGWKHPHSRGEDFSPYIEIPGVHGNTPTRVGKTVKRLRREIEETETPPLAWGRPSTLAFALGWSRNTPTRVGKT